MTGPSPCRGAHRAHPDDDSRRLGRDNLIAREGICRILEIEEDIELVTACSDLATLRYSVGEAQPDVVVADIRMPPTKTDEGIRLAAELRTTHPEIGVVILSQYAEPLYATTLLEEGSDRRADLLKDRVHHRGDLSRAVPEVAEVGRSSTPESWICCCQRNATATTRCFDLLTRP